MPYYNDVPYYYGGASYANHSSLMTGTGRTPFHNPLTPRFSPHLSTISESPLNQLHRFAIRSPPISVRRVRRVIDTKDIDVSSPRILSHNGNRPRNRLQRNRPTIKIRSQALKDNPVLREHNEKHEKSVGELLMEKFFIKDTKLDGDGNQQIRLYHQVGLNRSEKPQEQEAIQKRITRRFTRRRSSADLQLSPEQLQQKVAYAEVQAKVLDSLVAEEQAQIENEIRRGTLMRKDTTTRGSIAHSYYTDSDTTQEEKKTARLKKTMNKTKKRKKSTIDNSWLADKIDNRQSSTCNEVSTDSEIEEKSNGPKPQMYKIEACNSTGDFSTIWMNASSENEKCKSMVEQFRESVKIPIPKTFETENKIDTFPKNVDETEMQIVLPMRKPYVKDSSRNSVYLTVRKPTEKLEEKLEEIEKLNSNENQLNLTNGFVDVKKDDELNSLTNKDSLESNDDVQTINDIKDATLKKIPDKPKKIKSSAKTNIYSTLDNNLNLESKDSLKSNDDVQTTNEIKDLKKISDESKKLESSARKNIYSALDNNLDIENKDSPKLNDDMKMTNDNKDITLEKISDKSKKVESSAKKNIYSALDNNLNLESKELKSNDIQTTNDIKDIKEISDKSKKLESSSKKNIYSTLDNNLDIENKNSLKSNDVQVTNDIKDITLKKISDKSKPKQLESSAKKNIYSTLDNNLNIEDKNSLKSNDDVQMTNEVKDITLKKIPDKPKKIKSLAKTNIYSALDNNLNLESKELKSNDIQTINDIKDVKEISDESKKLEPSSKKNIYSTLDNNLNIGDKNSLKSNDDVQMTSDVKDITLKKISDKSDNKPKQLESSAKKNIYSTLDNLNIEDKNSLKSNDDVQMTNEVKDITLKKIPDKFKKMELTKKNSTLDNNLNTGNKIASKTDSDVRENDKNDAPLSKSAVKSMQSSVPTVISTKNDAQNHDAQIKQLPKNIVTNIKKDESGKNDNVITAMKSLDCPKTVSTIEMPGDFTTKDSSASKTDKLTEEKDKLKMSATLREATKRSVVSSEANDNAGENSANSATCHLPKPSKINTDRNNVIEAPELSLRETAQYLANPPESAEEVLALPEKKMNKESNLAKTPFFNAPKKTNSVDANKSTLKTGVTQTNDIANLVTKGMTLLKEMNDEVRSTDRNEEMKSITDVKPSKVDLNIETLKNKIEKPNGNISRKSSIKMTKDDPSKVETEIIATKKSEPKESNLLKTDIKKIDNVDIEKDSGDSDLSNLKNNVPKLDAAKSKFKTKTLPKTAANETDKMVSSKIKKDSDIFKITKSNDDKSILFPQKDRDMPRNLKKGIPVDSKKSMNDCLSNNISNVQQTASVNEKTADKIPIKKEPTKPLNKITEEPTKLLSKITEKKPVIVDVSYDKSQEKGGQLSKSASTESIDFWSEIKAASSPEGMKSKQESGFSFYETKVENIDPTNCMFNDSLAEKKSLITSVKNSDDKKAKTNVEKGVVEFSNSMIEPSNVVVEEEKEKEKTIVEPPKVKNKETAKLVKTTEKSAPKVQKKKKNLSIAIGVKDSNSIVKKAPLKHDSAISTQPDSTTPDVTTVAASEVSTSLPEVTIPIINIIEECNEDFNSHKIDDENSKTPTNEPSSDLFLTATISKWSDQDNLTNSDDVETPIASEETSLVGSPNISPSSLKTKHSTKKKKKTPSAKKTPSTKSEKEVKKIRSNESTITSQQNTLIPEKPFSAKPSPNSSPRNTPSQRPLDLIRMFYTTPSALLTATPRDLSKIRRAKIKKRRHQLKTPSVSSDSTGSTTSTATTGSTDGSRSTCVELDDDSEHKNSTRSNDSGFDGSPRILTPSQSSDNQRNSDISERFPSGRITPPATNLPRFKKYAVTDFNFLKVLGKGSFGKVLLAELCGTECLYAVKCLKKDVVLEDDDVECTLIERKVLTLATRHPYLCHLFCTFQTNSHLFFVMEYLNGGDLMFHIQKSGRFPETRARFYAAEIWSGLNFLHKKGIVYRDLKLDNVLLDFEGHIRIADFGMCKLQIFLDRTADTFCGTPDYMAPEIIKGLKYNHAVDWWSYGVLLYEMLTGQSPFSGCDEDELFWSICNERPFIPRYLSQEASDMLICLLEKDSAKRPPSHEIAMHAFFQHLPWDRLERRQLEPPFKPAIDHTLDTKYFDTAFTTERPRLTPVPEQILTSMDQGVFRGFSYTNPNATD